MRLTLFFTRGNSLATWHAAGSFEREVALYKALQKQGMLVSFLTYGTASDTRFAQSIPGIELLHNRWNLPLPIYELLLPWLHASSLRRSDLFKTNQMKGAHTALVAGQLFRKPVIVRMGYLWSDLLARTSQPNLKTRFARLYEDWVMRIARAVIVTTPAIQQEILQRNPGLNSKLRIIPNHVDTQRFHPSPEKPNSRQVIYIGRLSAEKNLFALLEAMQTEGAELTLIGKGPQEQELRKFAERSKAQVTFRGVIPNEALPDELNRAAVFVLPSFFEGHPKALLEAMACGLAVLGTDVVGIRDLIVHGETGWLCPPDPASIRAALRHLLSHPELRARLGHQARQYAVDHFSLDKLVSVEYELYQGI